MSTGSVKKYVQFLVYFSLFLLVALIRQSEFATSVDRGAYLMAMELSYSKLWLVVWEGVSALGRGEFVYFLAGLAALRFLYVRRDKSAAFFVLMMVVFFSANPLLKLFFHLDRPVSLSPYTDLETYTFPSGHAFNSFVLFYFLPRFAASFLHEGVARYYFSIVLSVIGIFLIGTSRVTLGAHWFFDVLGGWALGGMCCTLLLILLRKTHAAQKQEQKVL